ncbi:MAG: hypothetical protein ABUL72_05305, partial [Armatimonadota bacterium]
IAVDNNYQQTLYAGYLDGQIWYTVDSWVSSPVWYPIDNNAGTNPLPDRAVMQIVVDRTDYQVLYACLGGFSNQNLWKTTNRGATWTSISGSGVTGLPSVPVHSVAVDPNNANHLFCGTEVGVFESSDGGASWSTSDFGPSNAPVFDLRFLHGSKTKLLVGTYGRGAWIYDLTNLNMGIDVLTNNGGDPVTAHVSLSDPAPAGGVDVPVSFNLPQSGLGASVHVPAGQTSVSFTFTPSPVDADTSGTLVATYLGSFASITFPVRAARIGSFDFAPSSVVGGNTTSGQLHFTAKVGPGGLVVNLASGSSKVQMPNGVIVPPGVKNYAFAVVTGGVSTTTVTTNTASFTSS